MPNENRSRFTAIIKDNVSFGDQARVALYANWLLNTTPGLRPSEAAQRAVDAYLRDPEAVRERTVGEGV